MQSITPVQSNEREIFMDVLRGFAIFGIFLANLNAFSWYDFVNPAATSNMLLPRWDNKMLFLHHVLIEGKFYSIFSFLFGWGVTLQLMRLQKKGVTPFPIIKRRLFIMLLLGAFHLLLWPGDIVFFYALLGFVLLPLFRFSNKQLLITSFILILSPVLLYGLKMIFPILNFPSEILAKTGGLVDYKLNGVTNEETFRAFINKANWFDILKGDIAGFFYRYSDLLFISRISKVLGMMLIGVVVGRTDFYKKIATNKKILFYIIAFGIFIALPANYMLAWYMKNNNGAYYRLTVKGFYQTIAYSIGVAPLAATYIALFMLLFQNMKAQKALSILAPVGKMAFSNYIIQTLIGNFVFYNAGLGYMQKVGPVYYTLFGLIIFIIQIIISTIWLHYFNYGPLEWLWRSSTYRKWQIMKKNNRVAI